MSDELDLLSDCSQRLWLESAPKGLYEGFAQVLGQSFAGTHFAVHKVSIKKDRYFFKLETLKLRSIKRLPEVVFTPLKKYAKEILKAEGVRSSFDYKNKEYQIVILKSLLPEPIVICWAQSADIQLDCREFLITQLQHQFSWLDKIDKAEDLIYTDDLTGLYNYRFLNPLMSSELKRCERYDGFFSVLFLDLDNFKKINDTFGHLVGSDILRQIGSVLRKIVRSNDSIIRYGGDEYVILLVGTNSKVATQVGERIRKQVETKNFIVSKTIQVKTTLSIGIAAYPEHGTDRAGLLKCADQAMYESKGAGRNRVSVGNVKLSQEKYNW